MGISANAGSKASDGHWGSLVWAAIAKPSFGHPCIGIGLQSKSAPWPFSRLIKIPFFFWDHWHPFILTFPLFCWFWKFSSLPTHLFCWWLQPEDVRGRNGWSWIRGAPGKILALLDESEIWVPAESVLTRGRCWKVPHFSQQWLRHVHCMCLCIWPCFSALLFLLKHWKWKTNCCLSLFWSKDMLYAIRSFIFRLHLIHVKIHGMCQAATFTENGKLNLRIAWGWTCWWNRHWAQFYQQPAACQRCELGWKPGWNLRYRIDPNKAGWGCWKFWWFLDGEMLEETNTEIFAMHSHYKALCFLQHLNCCLHQLELHCHTASQRGISIPKENCFQSILLDSWTHLFYGTRVVSRNWILTTV